jgi:hypothetical protein
MAFIDGLLVTTQVSFLLDIDRAELAVITEFCPPQLSASSVSLCPPNRNIPRSARCNTIASSGPLAVYMEFSKVNVFSGLSALLSSSEAQLLR